VTVSKEFDAEQPHPLEDEEARLYGFRKLKRRGDKKRNGFEIIIAETRGHVLLHNLGRPERWATKQDGLER
jgi:hypothetical protein